MKKNERLTVWNGSGLERLTREEFTERALNTPYHSPIYPECDFFDLTGHILLWEYIRTHIKDIPDVCHLIDLKRKGVSFIDIESYHRKVLENTSCFACVYANCHLEEGEKLMCEHCPLVWDNDSCCSSYSLYKKVMFSETGNEAAEYALKIRDLPVKKGVIVR